MGRVARAREFTQTRALRARTHRARAVQSYAALCAAAGVLAIFATLGVRCPSAAARCISLSATIDQASMSATACAGISIETLPV